MSSSWMFEGNRRASAQSQLVVLRAMHGAVAADHAERVWNSLSRACHHHAYELQPSLVEVRAVMMVVNSLLRHRPTAAPVG